MVATVIISAVLVGVVGLIVRTIYNDKKNALLLMPSDFRSLAVCINDKLDVEI